MSHPYKLCPQCQTPAPLDAGQCNSCGRRYSTQFDQDGRAIPPQQTISVTPIPGQQIPPSNAGSRFKRRGRSLAWALGGVISFGIIGWAWAVGKFDDVGKASAKSDRDHFLNMIYSDPNGSVKEASTKFKVGDSMESVRFKLGKPLGKMVLTDTQGSPLPSGGQRWSYSYPDGAMNIEFENGTVTRVQLGPDRDPDVLPAF